MPKVRAARERRSNKLKEPRTLQKECPKKWERSRGSLFSGKRNLDGQRPSSAHNRLALEIGSSRLGASRCEKSGATESEMD